RALRWQSIIGTYIWRFFFARQLLIFFFSSSTRPRQFRAPIFVRDQFALTALGQESTFDQDRRYFCQAQHREPCAFDTAVVLTELTENRMIDARRERHTLRIHGTTGLHVERLRIHVCVGS